MFFVRPIVSLVFICVSGFLITGGLGCGTGEEVDFSKGIIKPKISRSDDDSAAAGDGAKTEDESGSTDSPADGEADADGSESKDGQEAVAGSGDGAEAVAGPLAVDRQLNLAWLLDRGQISGFSNDGRYIVTGGDQGNVRLFDIEAGSLSRTFPSQSEAVTAVGVHPGNSQVAVATAGGQLRFWSTRDVGRYDEYQRQALRSGGERRGIGVHSGAVTAIAWHPEGDRAATAGADGTVRSWELPPSDALLVGTEDEAITAITVNAGNDLVTSVTASHEFSIRDLASQNSLSRFQIDGEGTLQHLGMVPETDVILAGSTTGAVHAVSGVEEKAIAKLYGHADPVTALRVATDGKSFVTGDKTGRLTLWRLPVYPTIPLARFEGAVEHVEVSPDRRFAAALVEGRGLSVIELSGTSAVRSVPGTTEGLTGFAFAPFGSVLAGGTENGAVRFWEVPGGRQMSELAAHDGPVRSLAVHPQDRIVATSGDDGRLRVLNWPTKSPQIEQNSGAVELASSRDGAWLGAVTNDGELRVWKMSDGKLSGRRPPDGNPVSTFTVGSEWVVSGGERGILRVMKTDSLAVVSELQISDAPLVDVTFDHTETSLFAVDQAGVVRSVPLPPPVTQELDVSLPGVTALAAVGEEQRIVAVGTDDVIRLSGLSGPQQEFAERGRVQSAATCVAATPDQSRVFTGHADGAVEFHTGTAEADGRRWETASEPVTSLSLRNDGKAFLTAHGDGTVRRWDAEVPQSLVLQGHTASIATLAVSPDGQRIASGGADKTVRLWDAETGRNVETLTLHEASVKAVIWLSDSQHVVSFDAEGTGILSKSGEAEPVEQWEFDSPVTRVTARLDQPAFVTAHEDGSVRSRSLGAEAARTLLQASDATVTGLSVAEEGRLLISRSSGEIVLTEIENPAERRTLTPEGRFATAALSHDGSRVIVGDLTGRIRFLPADGLEGGAVEAALHRSRVKSIELCGDELGISQSTGGDVCLWSTTGRKELSWPGQRGWTHAAAAPDGRFLVVAAEDHSIRVLRHPWQQTIPAHDDSALLASWSADGKGFVSAGEDGLVRQWSDAEAASVDRRLASDTDRFTIFAAASDDPLIAGVSGRSITVWSGSADSEAATLSIDAEVIGLSVSDDGSRLAATLENGDVLTYRTSDLQRLGGVSLSPRQAQQLCFTGESNKLVVGGDDPHLRTIPDSSTFVTALSDSTPGRIVWDRESRSVVVFWPNGSLARIDSDGQPVESRESESESQAKITAVSADGNLIAGLVEDNTIRLWETVTESGPAQGEAGEGGAVDGGAAGPVDITVEAPVQGLTLNADGSLVAVATPEGTTVLNHSGEVVQDVKKPKSPTAVTFTGGQATLAIASSSEGITFFSFSRSTFDRELPTPADHIRFSDRGELLASVGAGNTVTVWNVEEDKKQFEFEASSGSLIGLRFCNEDRILCAGAESGKVVVWDLIKNELRNEFETQAECEHFSASPDGRVAALTTTDGSVSIRDLADGSELERFPAGGTRATAFGADSQVMFSGSENGSVLQQPLTAVRHVSAHGGSEVTDVSLSKQGEYIISSGSDGTVSVTHSSGRRVRDLKVEGESTVGVLFDEQRNRLIGVTASEGSGTLTTWNFSDGTPGRRIPLEFQPVSITPDTRGGKFVVRGKHDRLHVFSTGFLKLMERVQPVDPVSDVALAGGVDALISASPNGALRLFAFHQLQSFQDAGLAVTALAWSPDGRYLAGGTEGKIVVWDGQTGEPVVRLSPGLLEDTGEEADQDGRAENQGGEEQDAEEQDRDEKDQKDNAKGEDAKSGSGSEGKAGRTEEALEPPAGNTPTSIRFTSDSDLYASFLDGSVRIWNLTGLREKPETSAPHTIFQHNGSVFDIAVFPEDSRLATACEDTTIRLWDVGSGQELVTFKGHKAPVHEVAFSKSGNQLYSTAADRSARVWSADSPEQKSDGGLRQMAIVDDAAALSADLRKQMANAKSDAERQRLRHLIRSLNNDSKESTSFREQNRFGSRIDRLRMALREAKNDRERRQARKELSMAMTEQSLKEKLAETTATQEREKLKAELRRIRSGGTAGQSVLPDTPAHEAARLDRELVEATTDAAFSSIRTQLDNFFEEHPVWPQVTQERQSEDQSHLLATIPTNFKFDARVFRPVALALTKDGLTVSAGRESAALRDREWTQGVVRVWDVPTRTELRAWTDVANSRLSRVRFSPSGDTLYTLPDMFVFELSSGYSQSVARGVAIGLSANREMAALGLRGESLKISDAVVLLDLKTLERRPQTLQAYEAMVPAVALSHDGSMLAASIRERLRHRLVLLDPETMQETAELEVSSHEESWLEYENEFVPGITHVVFSPDDRLLITYGMYGKEDYRLNVINLASQRGNTMRREEPMFARGTHRPITFVGDRDLVRIDSRQGLIVIDTMQNRPIQVIRPGVSSSRVRVDQLSHDGTVAAYGTVAGEVELHRIGRRDDPVRFQAHDGPIVGMAFADGNRMLVTAGEENTIRVWTLAAFYNSRPANTAPGKKKGRRKTAGR